LLILPETGQNKAMNITVKNVPDKVYRLIKREAGLRGRTVNEQVLEALAVDADHIERRASAARARKSIDKLAASIGPLPDSTPLIRSDRRR
jgi:hypothetical protein